ncbi:MAG: hypothetical protein WC937_04515 [Candidatus Omnitrophota bacterium]|nr:hypothetical protein [Candidatus Omnitrophota bacterium]
MRSPHRPNHIGFSIVKVIGLFIWRCPQELRHRIY